MVFEPATWAVLASIRSGQMVTTKWLESLKLWDWNRVLDVFQRLLDCHEVDIRDGGQVFQKPIGKLVHLTLSFYQKSSTIEIHVQFSSPWQFIIQTLLKKHIPALPVWSRSRHQERLPGNLETLCQVGLCAIINKSGWIRILLGVGLFVVTRATSSKTQKMIVLHPRLPTGSKLAIANKRRRSSGSLRLTA